MYLQNSDEIGYSIYFNFCLLPSCRSYRTFFPFILLNLSREILSKNKSPAARSILSGGTCYDIYIMIIHIGYIIKFRFQYIINLPGNLLEVHCHL